MNYTLDHISEKRLKKHTSENVYNEITKYFNNNLKKTVFEIDGKKYRIFRGGEIIGNIYTIYFGGNNEKF